MPIYKGNTKIVKLYKGTTQIVKRYKGTDLIYNASRLPAEFQEVEYLESSGTQYIDTNVSAYNLELQFNLDAVVKQTQPQYYRVFGSQSDDNLISFGSRWFYGNASSNRSALLSANDGNRHMFIANKNGIIIDNVNYPMENVITNVSILQKLQDICLFFQLGGNNNHYAKVVLYSCKIYDNSVLIRNFVPCYRKADNVAGLYDLVNGVFYTNAGTGTFIVGGNV